MDYIQYLGKGNWVACYTFTYKNYYTSIIKFNMYTYTSIYIRKLIYRTKLYTNIHELILVYNSIQPARPSYFSNLTIKYMSFKLN